MNHLLIEFLRFQNIHPNLADFGLSALKSSIIILMAFGIAGLLYKQSARARNWVWRTALGGLFALILWQTMPTKSRPTLSLPVTAITQTSALTEQPTEAVGEMSSAAIPLNAKKVYLSQRVLELAESLVAPFWISIATILLIVHALKAIICARWLRRNSRPWSNSTSRTRNHLPSDFDHGTIRISSSLDAPLLLGWFHPTVYLPENATLWSSKKLRYVLTHEFAHRTRGDTWWQFAAKITCCLWWWNPLSWIALKQLKAEAEQAADDLVILQEDAAKPYAELLVEMASANPKSVPAGIPMLGRTSFEQRIQSIMNHKSTRNTIGSLSAALLIIMTGLMVLSIGASIAFAHSDHSHESSDQVFYNSKTSDNALPQGDFHQNKGKADNWTGSLSSVSSQGNFIRLKANNADTVIETTLPRQADWKWLTLMARTRPVGKTAFSEEQQAGISITQLDASGKEISSPVTISESNREGYGNWSNRIKTLKLKPNTKNLKVSMQLTVGAGQLDCSEIFVIPSKAEDHLNPKLINQFFEAVASGNATIVKQMLSKEPRLVEARNGWADNGTPLIFSAWKGQPEVAQVLIDNGANLEAIDSNWKASALAWCGWFGSPETAEVLLKAGANPKFKSRYGVTPVSSAKAAIGGKKDDLEALKRYEKTIAVLSAPNS